MKSLSKLIIGASLLALASCGGSGAEKGGTEPPANEPAKAEAPAKDIGVGPIKSIDIPAEIDQVLADTGLVIFEAKCTACHKMGKRFIGPDLTDIVDRREPEWIMNMILDPELMVKENEAAKALLAEYLSPMANQSLTEEEARAILEYFRTLGS